VNEEGYREVLDFFVGGQESAYKWREKVVYLAIQDFNEKWANRKLRGFAEAQEALQRMFEERYC